MDNEQPQQPQQPQQEQPPPQMNMWMTPPVQPQTVQTQPQSEQQEPVNQSAPQPEQIQSPVQPQQPIPQQFQQPVPQQFQPPQYPAQPQQQMPYPQQNQYAVGSVIPGNPLLQGQVPMQVQQPQMSQQGQPAYYPPQPLQQPYQGQPGQMQGQQGALTPAQQLEQMRQSNANRGNSDSLKMNLKGVVAGNFNLLDTSLVYEGKCTKSVLKPTKDKSHEMVVLSLTVTFPEMYRGTMLTTNLNLIEESAGFYRSALEAAELFDAVNEEPLINDVSEFIGKFFRFSVTWNEWPLNMNPKSYRNQIIGALAKAFESPELQTQQGQQQPQQFTQKPMQPQQFTAPQHPQQPQQLPRGGFIPPNGYQPPQQPYQGQQGQTGGQSEQTPNFGMPETLGGT